MRDELQEELYIKFPTVLTSTVNGKINRCHLDIGDGWYDLIVTICEGVLSNKDRHEEYKKLLVKNERQEEIKNYHPIKAVQIKEKFGGLRFYVSGGDEFDRGVIFTAEAMSRKICEVCGEKGKTRDEGWMVTLCDRHQEERRWRKENGSKTVLSDSGQVG